MEAAREALDGAITALFSSSRGHTNDSTHLADICVCSCPLDPPDAWRALRDFPVLARWVVATWQRHAETMAPITHKKTRRASTANSTRGLERRAASASHLCLRLYQCGVLASAAADDSEAVAALLQAITADVFPRVLLHRMLSLNVRFRLIQHALVVWGSGVRVWIEDACVALQQELRDASAAHSGTGNASATTKKSKKRSRESMSGAFTATRAAWCERCVTSRSMSNSQPSSRSWRQCLLDELAKWTTRHQTNRVSLVGAVDGLCSMLNAPDVVRMLEPVGPSLVRRGLVPMGSASVSVARSVCDKIVDSICCDGQSRASASTWKLVWRRESAKCGVRTKLSMEEVVVAAAAADQFTRQVPPHDEPNKEQGPVSIGYQVIGAVMQKASHDSGSVIQILHAIRGALYRSLLTPLASTQLQPLLIYYVRQLFQRDVQSVDGQCGVKLDPQQGSSKGVSISDLVDCLQSLYAIATRDLDARSQMQATSGQRMLFELWFGAILHLSCRLPSPQLAPLWSKFLAAVAQCCEELKSSLPSCLFVTNFEAFVESIVAALIVSNGARLGSPGRTNIVEISADAANTSAMLSTILASARPRVVAGVLYQLMVAATRSEQMRGCLALFRDGGGIRRLLFPALAAFTKNAAGPQAIDSRFSSVVSEVYERVKRHSLGHGQVRALVYLLCEWDLHCERSRRSRHQEGDTFPSRQGMHIALQLGLWKDVVRVYAVNPPTRLRHESRAFLRFIIELLRSVDSTLCLPELEGSLFSVVSAISVKLQQLSDDDSASTAVAHSDDTVNRFLAAFTRCSSTQRCKDLLTALEKDSRLEDLVLSLRRWLGILAASPQSLPRETRIDLAVVANRLVYHYSENADVKTIQALLTPVDPVLISALQVYSRAATSATSSACAAPLISIVRLSLIIRSYLETTCVPDLLTLTTAILESLLNAWTQSSRDGMLKLLQGLGKFVVTEILVETLHDALLMVGDHARTRVVDNALAVLAVSESSRQSALRGVTFASELVSIKTTERWLPAFLTAGLSSDSPASSTALAQANAILSCIICALNREERDESEGREQDSRSVFSHAYALVALLSTVEAALRQTDSMAVLVQRIHDVHAQLRVKVEAIREPSGLRQLDGSYLLCAVYNQSEPRAARGKSPCTSCYTSGRVRIDSMSATGISLSGGSEWQRAINVPEESTLVPTEGIRFFVSFASWLRAAFRMPRHQTRQSEDVFVDTVLQFYLPVEFYGNTSTLTAVWLDVWIEQSLAHAQCVGLSMFQRKILLQLLSSDYSPWSRLIQCAHTLLQCGHAQASMPRDTVMIHIVESLDLTTLCCMRPSCYDTLCAMVSDMKSVLQYALCTRRDGPTAQLAECLRCVTPLVEVFVRTGLWVSSSPPLKEQDLVVGIETVFVQVRTMLWELLFDSAQDSQDRGWCRSYWHSLVARWKREYSHLNPSHSNRLFNALVIGI